MASLIVNQGLQRLAINGSQASGFSSSRFIQTMAVDDATGAFAAAHTKLNDAAGFTQEFDAAFDATPTMSGQTVIHKMTIPTGSGNFTIRRVSLHDNAAASVDGTSATLVGGVDGQSIAKTSDFSLLIELRVTFSSV